MGLGEIHDVLQQLRQLMAETQKIRNRRAELRAIRLESCSLNSDDTCNHFIPQWAMTAMLPTVSKGLSDFAACTCFPAEHPAVYFFFLPPLG